MAVQKKAPAKKTTTPRGLVKSAAKKSPAKKTPAKSGIKTGAESVPAKKPAEKRAAATKQAVGAHKTGSKTASRAAGVSVAKKSAKKAAPGRRYAPAASKQVEIEMREMHEGKLTIGKSKIKVTNPKQAIAIGLAEARRAGADVPPNPRTGK